MSEEKACPKCGSEYLQTNSDGSLEFACHSVDSGDRKIVAAYFFESPRCSNNQLTAAHSREQVLQKRVRELEGLLKCAEADETHFLPGNSRQITLDDLLSLLSSYRLDFREGEIPGDEYFAAWERQARKALSGWMESVLATNPQAEEPA